MRVRVGDEDLDLLVNRGLALSGARVFRQNMVFGEDVLLNNPVLERRFPALPMSYLWHSRESY